MIGPSGFNQAPKEQKQVIQVTDARTGEVVHEVDVTGKSDGAVERSIRGMLRNMDRENFCCGTVFK